VLVSASWFGSGQEILPYPAGQGIDDDSEWILRGGHNDERSDIPIDGCNDLFVIAISE
jgi:hypothetical protein